jgi:hypothetical protein
MTPNQIWIWQQRRMVDEALDAHLDWLDECQAVWDAYRRWASAPVRDAGSLFHGYSAALEREERACEVYEAQIRRVGHVMGTKLDPAAGP